MNFTMPKFHTIISSLPSVAAPSIILSINSFDFQVNKWYAITVFHMKFFFGVNFVDIKNGQEFWILRHCILHLDKKITKLVHIRYHE